MTTRQPEQRRDPRIEVSWPAVMETDSGLVRVETVNLSRSGVKIRAQVPLQEGKLVRVHFCPPDMQAVAVDAIVWRTEAGGAALFFAGSADGGLEGARGSIVETLLSAAR